MNAARRLQKRIPPPSGFEQPGGGPKDNEHHLGEGDRLMVTARFTLSAGSVRRRDNNARYSRKVEACGSRSRSDQSNRLASNPKFQVGF
jgi:hypothetical protein